MDSKTERRVLAVKRKARPGKIVLVEIFECYFCMSTRGYYSNLSSNIAN